MSMDLGRRRDSSSKGKATATATAEEKVCVAVAINGYMGIFLLDLGKDQDLEGADAKGFVDTLPNFRIAAVFDFYVVKNKLFLIDSDSDSCRPDLPPHFYSIELEKVSKMSNQRLDVTDLTKCSGCFSRKLILRCLPYRDSLLLFSSLIHFEQYYYDDNKKYYYDYNYNKNYRSAKFSGMHHFELYDPANADGCRVLPQLVVCLPRDSYDVLRLYDPVCKTFYDEGFVGFRPYGSDSYAIVSFGVDVVEDKFIIGTEFGRTFSLKLDGSDCRWRLCGEEEGYYFSDGSKTIITWNGICLDAFGATDFRTRWLKQQQKGQPSRQIKSDGRMRAGPSAHKQYGDGSSRRASFPPTCKEIEKCGLIFRAGPYSSGFDLQKLKGNDPSCTRICIVRQALDYIGARYERSSKLYLWLNVLEVDLQELANDDHDLDDDKILKRLKSFKYAVPETIYVPEPFVEGLFYY